MPLACLCIFVDGLVHLQASLTVLLIVRRLSFETGDVHFPHEHVGGRFGDDSLGC